MDALPVSKSVISNTTTIIELLPSKILKEWVMFPNVNGTILLTIKRKNLRSSFCIGTRDYSFYATIDEKDCEGIEKFDVNSFIATITSITNSLVHSK